MLQQCGTLIILCHVTAPLNHLALGAKGVGWEGLKVAAKLR